MKLRLSLVAAGLLLSLGAWGQSDLPGGNDAPTTPTAPAVDTTKIHLDQLLGAQVPMSAQFKDWDGTSVTMGSLLGVRPAILVPIWYNCTGVCNVELQNLLATIRNFQARKLGVDYDIVVMSINPSEGPALAAAKRSNVLNTETVPGSPKGWHFLTGTMPNILAVTDAVGFHFTYDSEKKTANHPSGIMVLSPAGQVSSYLYGAQYDLPKIQKDIDTAKQGRIGTKTEEIFFGCICVDPVTGKRSIEVQNVLRLMGVITVLVLIGSIMALSGKKIIRR